jgi:hypothetical protein
VDTATASILARWVRRVIGALPLAALWRAATADAGAALRAVVARELDDTGVVVAAAAWCAKLFAEQRAVSLGGCVGGAVAVVIEETVAMQHIVVVARGVGFGQLAVSAGAIDGSARDGDGAGYSLANCTDNREQGEAQCCHPSNNVVVRLLLVGFPLRGTGTDMQAAAGLGQEPARRKSSHIMGSMNHGSIHKNWTRKKIGLLLWGLRASP